MKPKLKIIITTAILIAILIISSIFMINYCKIQKLSKDLNQYSIEFYEAENRNKKLEVIQSLNSNKDTFKKIQEEYHILQNKLINWLISDYNQSIKDNDLENLEELNDKKLIKSSKENLKELNEKIKIENLLSSKEIEVFSNKIEELIKSYDERLNQIVEAEKKAEEERIAKEKAEAEAAKKAAEEAERKNQKDKQNNNQQSSSDSYLVKHHWSYDLETGEKYEGSDKYEYSDGKVYNEDGNLSFDLNDWCETY